MVVERLLAHDAIDVNQARTDKYGITPLYIACQKNHEAVVWRLLENRRFEENKEFKITPEVPKPQNTANTKHHKLIVA